MQILRVTLPYRPIHGFRHRFVFAGDFHYGAVNCAEDLLNFFVKTYAAPEEESIVAPDGVPTSILLMGDEVDAINCQDKRFDPRMLHPRYYGQTAFLNNICRDFIQLMSPLRSQILGGVLSNHHSQIVKMTNIDPGEIIRHELGIRCLGHEAYIVVQWQYYGRTDGGTRTTVIRISHGVAGNNLYESSRSLSLEKNATPLVDADIVVMGHSHSLSCDNPRPLERLSRDNTKIYTTFQYLLQSGCFLLPRFYDGTGWAPYYEEKGFKVSKPAGWVVAEISFPPNRGGPVMPLICCYCQRFGVEAGRGGSRVVRV